MTEHEPGGREETVLGVDYGTVRIGLALGFPHSGLVIPLPGMPHPGEEAEAIRGLAAAAQSHAVSRVVLGNPIHMSGEESPMSRTVARVRGGLEELLAIPIALQDERLTSADAEARLREQGLRWWQYDKARVDALSAMAILREHLALERPDLVLDGPEPDAPPPSPEAERRGRRRDARRRMRERRRREE